MALAFLPCAFASELSEQWTTFSKLRWSARGKKKQNLRNRWEKQATYEDRTALKGKN